MSAGITLLRDVLAEFLASTLLLMVQTTLLQVYINLHGIIPPASFDPALDIKIGIGMGCAIVILLESFAHFGGGHMNPVITVILVLAKAISIIKGLLFILAQCVGSITGVANVYGLTPEVYRVNTDSGAGHLHAEVSKAQGFGAEFVLTFFLIFVVFSVFDDRIRKHSMPSVPVGMAVAIGAFCGAQTNTGGRMNPICAFGPAVVANVWDNHWIYWVGPFGGGLSACIIYNYIFVKATQTTYQQLGESLDNSEDEYLSRVIETTVKETLKTTKMEQHHVKS